MYIRLQAQLGSLRLLICYFVGSRGVPTARSWCVISSNESAALGLNYLITWLLEVEVLPAAVANDHYNYNIARAYLFTL